MLLEVDHSSGHLKELSDGLMVNAMGLEWGGKTNPKRDSIMEHGCLGEDLPVIDGRKLAIGMLQKMIFQEGDPPPFQDLTALPNDRPITAEEKSRKSLGGLVKSNKLTVSSHPKKTSLFLDILEKIREYSR